MHPSVHRRPGYPLVGCAPAEPTSVSPGGEGIAKARLPSKSKTGRCSSAPGVPVLKGERRTVR